MNFRQLGALLLGFLCFSSGALGQMRRLPNRLSGNVASGSPVALAGSRSPRALAANDMGVLPRDTAIRGITLVFTRSAAQEAALQVLLAAQQDPASPLYHQWLTPESFGARFGMSDADLATVETWLQSQGFTMDRVSRAHDRISFSGTAAQVDSAFSTELHRYRNEGKVEYAPSTELSLPAGLVPVVTAITHLSTFRPKPMVKRTPTSVAPAYTLTSTQDHFLTPSDIATMYDVTSLYNAGYTGSGQTIAIAGESYIQTLDIANFQAAANLPSNMPTLVLEPNTGASARYEGDEFESDIDVEYASGTAPGAQILLVYIGDSPNYNTFDAFDYAIEENLAPVVSVSYGSCEPLTSQTYANQGNALFAQGAAQGQTLIASSGDDGSTPCYGATDSNGNPEPTSLQQGLAVSYPASSPYVTSIGGTQMAAGTYTAGASQYWQAAGSSSIPNSLLSYVPETVWNEDSTMYGLAAGGGGSSIYFGAPTWQTGIPGIPAGNTHRLNPDISLQASTASPGYLACSSDPSAFSTGQTSSCTRGVYDSTGKFLTAAGGTSFGAPIFAGLMAVLNQQQHGAGLGLVNPTLYALASNSATYATAFHDITAGNNGCASYPRACSAGSNVYTAGVGYDQATGLGSIDFAKLVGAWPASAATSLAGTTVTLKPVTLMPASGASDPISIAVTSTSGVPTGTVSVALANPSAPVTSTTGVSSVPGSTQAGTLALTNGQASYTFPGTTVAGTQVIVVKYSGDALHAPSTASVALTLANTLIPGGSFTFTVGNVTVPTNSTATTKIVVTPTGGYNGVINFTLPSLPAADCFATGYSVVSNTTATTTINLAVGNGTACTSGAAVRLGSDVMTFPTRVAGNVPAKAPLNRKPLGMVLASLFAVGLMSRRRTRKLPALLALGVMAAAMTLGLNGCGGTSQSTTPPPTGTTTTPTTLSLTLQGSDTISLGIAASAPIRITVQ